MTEKVGTLVYVKPEPLISEQFEEAVKIANRDSVETLEALEVQLAREQSRFTHLNFWAFGSFLLSCLVASSGWVLAFGSGGTVAVLIALAGLVGIVTSWVLERTYGDKANEREQSLSAVTLALQLKTRTDEIIAMLPKRS